jgi:hypothetical protein
VVRDERIAPDLVLEIGGESAAVDRRADIADGNQQPPIVGSPAPRLPPVDGHA